MWGSGRVGVRLSLYGQVGQSEQVDLSHDLALAMAMCEAQITYHINALAFLIGSYHIMFDHSDRRNNMLIVTLEKSRVKTACQIIRRCENDLNRQLSDGERRDLLMDNTDWLRDQIFDTVAIIRLDGTTN